MNDVLEPSASTNQSSKWRLWIDRCGGFELIASDRWLVGGARPDALSDIQVHSDWRRVEGQIVRREGQYLWRAAAPQLSQEGILMGESEPLPVAGSTKLVFSKPTPLSGTAKLTLRPPHRFGHHIDSVILVDQTVLIGRDESNHIRTSDHDSELVLVLRDGIWKAKQKPGRGQTSAGSAGANDFVELIAGRHISVGEMDMTLEKV